MKRNNQRILQTLTTARIPLIIWMVMIGFTAIFVMTTIKGTGLVHVTLINDQARHHGFLDPMVVLTSVFSIIASIWFSPRIYRWHSWLVIGIPMILVSIYTVLFNRGAPVILAGTYPVFMIESIIIYDDNRQRSRLIFWPITFIYAILLGVYALYVGWLQGLVVIQAFAFLMAIVMYYWSFYRDQVKKTQQLEDLYSELQLAYSQVEESAVRAERQRVARELHDTLTQGLAGIVMQLEATDSFLLKGDPARAEEIVANTIQDARHTLHESRTTLTDLRATTEESLPARLQLVSQAVDKNYHLKVDVHLNQVPDYSPEQLTEITRIVTEALANVAKHAQTDQALIQGDCHDQIFKLKVIDFGRGFDMKNFVKYKKAGHFGLQGLQERADRLGGVLTVISAEDEGTTVTLTLPTTRKELA
jgi:NarL family two-component system sensor histidine kinase YdfH